jgi:trehalose synthase
MKVKEVAIQALSLDRFLPLVGEERGEALRTAAAQARDALQGRTVWNVNSTATGGGVAEMLQPLIAYTRGTGVNARWMVIGGDPAFFAITKRLHNRMHGQPGDGGPLGDEERRQYQATVESNAAELQALVQPGDIVLLHDPQTAGLIATMKQCGAITIWRSHIGIDQSNDLVEDAWAFLRPYVEQADACVFSRREYVPAWLGGDIRIIPPSIDPFSTKNEDMAVDTVQAIVAHAGLIQDPGTGAAPVFTRRDGSPGRVDLRADIVRAGPSPLPQTPLVVQVSRWDRLKDMPGVMRGFADAVDGTGAHLALVGPNVSGVTDDPEGPQVLDECIELWRNLPHAARSRIQLVCLPMTDVEENAAMVNAIQRHAAVVVQKSLAEGFGLTVAEAMWKARPVIGSRIGGIQDQIADGETGVLLDDPSDLAAFGTALKGLLVDFDRTTAMGEAGRQRAIEHFLGSRHLMQYAEVMTELVAG